MIIPIRCFTCSNLIADKYKKYIEEIEKDKKNTDIQNRDLQEIFKKFKLKRYCCRRMLFTQSDILNKLK
jgi:DNA-directed RNA polymerase subunit N (RpoN/RPB10)